MRKLTLILLLFLIACSKPIEVNPVLEEAEPFIEKMSFEDIELRALASNITNDCETKECQISTIYRYVVDNFKYYKDPRTTELIQTPEETLKVKGGDCEDLNILMNSLLENIGVKTYLVLTESHVYGLACGVNDTWNYIYKSIIEQAADENKVIKDNKLYWVEVTSQTISIDNKTVYYHGGNGSDFPAPFESMDIEYSLNSTQPLDIYVVESNKEHHNFVDKKPIKQYPECKKRNVLKIENKCNNLTQHGGIILDNDNDERAIVDLYVEFYFAFSKEEVMKDIKLFYYIVGNEACIVLDATAGKYGYPGYDENEGRKIAIDPASREYSYLE